MFRQMYYLQRVFFVVIVLFSCMIFSNTALAYERIQESSWIDQNSNDYTGVYGGEEDAVTIKEDEEESSNLSLPEKMFMWILNSVARPLDTVLTKLGLDMNSIVMGRVAGNGVKIGEDRVALFTFELNKGNFYGIISLGVYNILRGIFNILIALLITSKVVQASIHGNSTKTYASLKSSLSDGVLVFVLLAVMPNFLEIFLYMRDLVLYMVSIDGVQKMLPGLTGSDTITTYFANCCEDSLMNAFLYLGSLFLTVWYAVQYAGIALSFVVHVMSFPFICILSFLDKNAFNGWIKEVLGAATIPIIDSTLLLIPAFIGYYGKMIGNVGFTFSVVQLLVCTMLIPARGAFRKDIGLSPSMGLEMAGLMALSGAINVGRNTIGSVASSAGKVAGGILGYQSNMEEANRYAELDMAEEGMKREYADMINHTGDYADTTYGDWTATGVYGIQGIYGLSPGSINSDRIDGISVDGMGIHLGSIGSSRTISGFGMDGGPGVSDYQTDLNDRLNAVNEKYATITNVDSSVMNGISNAKKAELYKKRANQELFKGVASGMGGLTGTIAGSVVGFGAGTFFSSGAKVMIMGAGSMMGNSIGNVAGLAVGEGVLRGTEAYSEKMSSIMGQDAIIQAAMAGRNREEQYPIVSMETGVFKQNLHHLVYSMGDSERMEGSVEDEKVNFINYMKNNNEYFDTMARSVVNFENEDMVKDIHAIYDEYKENKNGFSKDQQKEAFMKQAMVIMGNHYSKELNHNQDKINSTGIKEKDIIFNNTAGKALQKSIEKNKDIVFNEDIMKKYGWSFERDSEGEHS